MIVTETVIAGLTASASGTSRLTVCGTVRGVRPWRPARRPSLTLATQATGATRQRRAAVPRAHSRGSAMEACGASRRSRRVCPAGARWAAGGTRIMGIISQARRRRCHLGTQMHGYLRRTLRVSYLHLDKFFIEYCTNLYFHLVMTGVPYCLGELPRQLNPDPAVDLHPTPRKQRVRKPKEDRKSTRRNSSHSGETRMPSSA